MEHSSLLLFCKARPSIIYIGSNGNFVQEVCLLSSKVDAHLVNSGQKPERDSSLRSLGYTEIVATTWTS